MYLLFDKVRIIFQFPLFGCFVIFIIWLAYERKKSSKHQRFNEKDFWEKENLANSTRKVNLDTIDYLKLPMDLYPIGRYWDSQLIKLEEQLLALSEKRFLNITGISSTELKLKYGPSNLEALNEMDDTYISVIKTIYEYGCRLHELGHPLDAISVLETGINILSDISGNYKLLAQLYIDTNQSEKINNLIEKADKLNSIMKEPIIDNLNAILKDDLEFPKNSAMPKDDIIY